MMKDQGFEEPSPRTQRDIRPTSWQQPGERPDQRPAPGGDRRTDPRALEYSGPSEPGAPSASDTPPSPAQPPPPNPADRRPDPRTDTDQRGETGDTGDAGDARDDGGVRLSPELARLITQNDDSGSDTTSGPGTHDKPPTDSPHPAKQHGDRPAPPTAPPPTTENRSAESREEATARPDTLAQRKSDRTGINWDSVVSASLNPDDLHDQTRLAGQWQALPEGQGPEAVWLPDPGKLSEILLGTGGKIGIDAGAGHPEEFPRSWHGTEALYEVWDIARAPSAIGQCGDPEGPPVEDTCDPEGGCWLVDGVRTHPRTGSDPVWAWVHLSREGRITDAGALETDWSDWDDGRPPGWLC